VDLSVQSAETFEIWLLLGTATTDDFFENLQTFVAGNYDSFHEIESFLETETFSASQEIFRILYNLNIHYRVHNSPPLATTRSRNNPLHVSPTYFLKTHFNIITLFTPITVTPFFSLKYRHETLY